MSAIFTLSDLENDFEDISGFEDENNETVRNDILLRIPIGGTRLYQKNREHIYKIKRVSEKEFVWLYANNADEVLDYSDGEETVTFFRTEHHFIFDKELFKESFKQLVDDEKAKGNDAWFEMTVGYINHFFDITPSIFEFLLFIDYSETHYNTCYSEIEISE